MSTIAEAILDFDGPTPRVVADLRSVSFEIEYVRDDVEDRYSDGDLEEAYQLVMSNQVTGDDFKRLVGRNRYQAQTLFFDDLVVFLFPSDRYDAVFASYDYGEEFPVNDLVSAVSEARATE
ncbi:hypothetical protein [Halorubrum laminariae]|uniref:Uncharacterized protein n=1 Tax=Halorubrum laminariae TaxID=1433523 RepID=A0ABD6BVA3_9EURY|nr:hypothetical protein [Halorubrum laminariae]